MQYSEIIEKFFAQTKDKPEDPPGIILVEVDEKGNPVALLNENNIGKASKFVAYYNLSSQDQATLLMARMRTQLEDNSVEKVKLALKALKQICEAKTSSDTVYEKDEKAEVSATT